ncbi:MAG: hypothetical protein IPP40_07275 [bacterium]|nr:hypothetical protein [bacterium]
MRNFILGHISAIILTCSAFAQAPDTLWTRTYGNEQANSLNRLCLTNDGGICAIGSSYSLANGNYDFYAVRLDGNGDSLWSREYGHYIPSSVDQNDYGQAITELPNGSFCLYGFGALYIGGPHRGLKLVNIASNGTEAYENMIDYRDGWTANDNAAGIHVLSDGSVLSTGTSYRIDGNNVYRIGEFIKKTDTDGFGSLTQLGHGVPESQFYWVKNSILLSGDSYAYTGNKATPSTWNINHQIILSKGDSNLNNLWLREYGGTGYEDGLGLQATPDGGYIVCGYTNSYGNGYQGFLLKCDANGDSVWMRMYGGSGNESFNAVELAPSGGFVIAGYTTSYGAGGYDAWVIETDENGDTLWTKTIGDAAGQTVSDCKVAPSGSVVLAGNTASVPGHSNDAWVVALETILQRTITLTSPIGGEVWEITDSVEVTWSSENLTENVNIELNRDYPNGDWETLAFNAPNTGSYVWRVTYPATSNARVRVLSNGVSPVGDSSSTNFTIPAPAPEFLPGLAVNPFQLLGK